MARKKHTSEPQQQTFPLRLEWRSPQELAENPLNWRRHPEAQMSALADVIGEVGWAGACLFNEQSGRLIDGHARRKLALAEGCEKVPVLIGSWTDEQERMILATLDPLAAMAEADTTALAELLQNVETGSEVIQQMLSDMLDSSVAVLPAPTDPANDPATEWQGMPEFNHEDKEPFRSLIVHFTEEKDVGEFARLIEQELPASAKYIYYPYRDRARHATELYGDEP